MKRLTEGVVLLLASAPNTYASQRFKSQNHSLRQPQAAATSLEREAFLSHTFNRTIIVVSTFPHIWCIITAFSFELRKLII